MLQVDLSTMSLPTAENILLVYDIFVPLGSEDPLIATVDTVMSELEGLKSNV